MNKILLLIIIPLLTISMSFGQGLATAYTEVVPIAVDKIPNAGTSDEGEFKLYFKIVNTSTDTIKAIANRSVYEMFAGHGSYFCWDFCYDSTGSASQDPIELAPNDTTNFGQYIVFRPNNIKGYSKVQMQFVNINDGNDAVTINYEFSVDGAPNSIEDKIDLNLALSRPYPNPATTQVNLDYDLPPGIKNPQLSIFNLIGQKIKTVDLDGINGTAKIETSRLRSGIYFLFLMIDGKDITSRKMVISK